MKKKYGFIVIVIILTAIIGIQSAYIMLHGKTGISAGKAKQRLQNYLVDWEKWSEDYELCALDPITGKMGNADVYRFEARYKDTVKDIGGRLVDSYAITVDGKIIFWYDSASNEWIVWR